MDAHGTETKERDPLRERHGSRSWRRFNPNPEAPASVALQSDRGWALKDRVVADISMGGIAVVLSATEAQSIRVGDPVAVALLLSGKSLRAMGTVRHVDKGTETIAARRRMGLEFRVGKDFMDTRVGVSAYLHALTA